nr:bifunctional UDP-sugar hydrolase/5'-nucleotidase [uncultured Ruminococcus sp.]
MKSESIKKFGCVLLSAIMLSGISVCAVSAEEKSTEIHIVHTNDIHGYYKSTSGGQIGFDAVKTIADKENADLILDAGDTFHGQSFATVEEGKSIAELMDAVGYDAMTPGNHDWSYSADRLRELDRESSFTILASNVADTNGDRYFDNNFYIKNVTADDGTKVRVGVFGVIDEDFYTSTSAKNVENVRFENSAETATAYANFLRDDENCDIILALTHNANPEKFIAETSGIDAVIAGHQHILIDKYCTDSDGKSVKLVEANCFFKNVGVLTLTYSNEKGVTDAVEKTYSSVDTQGMSDEKIASDISAIEKREQSVLSEVIGESSREYAYSWEELRTSEQEIGRIVTAAYLDFTGADVAMENAGGIRSGIPKGNVTYSDLISISPYGNVLVEKELTGQQIIDILEFSVDLMKKNNAVYDLQKQAIKDGEDPYQYSWPDNSGSVMQFSGLSAVYDYSKPYGSRVSDVKIGGKAIDTLKTYRVVSNNYAFDSSDYGDVASLTTVKEYTTCEQILRDYIGKGDFEKAAANANLVEKSSQSEEPTATQKQTVQTAPTGESATVGTTSANPTSATGGAATLDSTPSQPDKNGGVQTGVTATAVMMLVVISSGVLFALAERKKRI